MTPENTNSPPRPPKKRKSTDRTSQACIKCRSQKMKCIGASDPPCRRCRITNSLCDFVPRANAAIPLSPNRYPSHTCTEIWRNEVNKKVRDLEEGNLKLQSVVQDLLSRLENGTTRDDQLPSGVSSSYTTDTTIRHNHDEQGGSNVLNDSVEMGSGESNSGIESSGVWSAIEALKDELSTSLAQHAAWESETITKLWTSFRSHMPGLHFFSGQVSFTHPTPLLAVSILYVAAAHYPSADLASFQPIYFRAFARAVGSLSIPDLGRASGDIPITYNHDGASSDKFDDVLGIILVGLLAIGWVDTVGMWVHVGYRLLLDGMALERGKRLEEWKGLWEGLRTIELEHSSLHLVCPALPVIPPDPPFSSQSSSGPSSTANAATAIGELLQTMQNRMPRFVGRGLPTVWETVCCQPDPRVAKVQAKTDDLGAIQSWAGEIDQWYARHAPQNATANMYVRSVILLNYHLHKLFVLSIFLPLRGVNSVSSNERKALLESSRLVLQIEGAGFEVWSSWDLVMLTHASLILLSSVVTGTSDHRELKLVQYHLNVLTGTYQTPPSLRHTLSERLERALQTVRTPPSHVEPAPVPPSRDHYAPRSTAVQLALPPVSVQPSPSALRTRQRPSVNDANNQVVSNGNTSSDFLLDTRTLFMPQAPAFSQLDLSFDKQLDQTTWDSNRETQVQQGGLTDDNLEWPPFLLSMFGYDQTSQDNSFWTFGGESSQPTL
ncbi:hypothetical protein IAR55_000009 [Kwoniella newhampshirensis]|uniref:Zn(2)-C6 fungal-type domain-containing protein n=1 Tax=Kwoniella newhampshirensis TaxID=1651941 RepID=A0AAW0Z5Z5_9TREE